MTDYWPSLSDALPRNVIGKHRAVYFDEPDYFPASLQRRLRATCAFEQVICGAWPANHPS